MVSVSLPIYLDYAATTPVHPDVAEAMMQCLMKDGKFGNPASRAHRYGWQAEEAVEVARKQLANLIGADTREIVWTSGATESNNLALKGVVDHLATQKPLSEIHIIVSSIEHKSVLDTAEHIERSGVNVSYAKPQPDGRITTETVENLLQENTVLVSVMHANNETGVINPIKDIGKMCRARGVLFHTDCAQTCGKVPVDLKVLEVDFMSMSAHKMYGPKGVGALYVRRHPDVKISEQMHGGRHERGMRSGTLATHQIVGFGEAAKLASQDLLSDQVRVLRDRLWQGLKDEQDVKLVGSEKHRLPGHMNLSFIGIDGETLLMSLQDLAISSGSACMSTTIEPSYVLTEMGLSESRAQSSLRFSLGRFTTIRDIDKAIASVKKALAALNRASA